jgi:hypothetical protein
MFFFPGYSTRYGTGAVTGRAGVIGGNFIIFPQATGEEQGFFGDRALQRCYMWIFRGLKYLPDRQSVAEMEVSGNTSAAFLRDLAGQVRKKANQRSK